MMTLLVNGIAAATSSPLPWTAGSYAIFSVDASLNFTLTLKSGAVLASAAPVSGASSIAKAISGSDAMLGDWEGLSIGDAHTIKWYKRLDAFTFGTAIGGSVFPELSSRAPSATKSDGPLLLFENATTRGTPGPVETVVLSAADHFTVQFPALAGSWDKPADSLFDAADLGGALLGVRPQIEGTPPAGTTLTALLLARPDLTRAYRGWGSFLRQAHNTTRHRGSGLGKLSCVCPLLPAVVCCCVSLLLTIAADVRVPPALDWDDNEAGYSDWGQARNLNAQGVPEDKMKKLAASYKQQGVPIGAWEVDCNFQCKPTPRSPMGTSFVLFSRFFPTHGRPWVFSDEVWWPSYGGWCWKDWLHWNTTAFPSGGKLSSLVGGLPMTYCRFPTTAPFRLRLCSRYRLHTSALTDCRRLALLCRQCPPGGLRR